MYLLSHVSYSVDHYLLLCLQRQWYETDGINDDDEQQEQKKKQVDDDMDRLQRLIQLIRSKTSRMVIMLILTVGIAIAEIAYGIRSRSQLLIADGLFSFAEGIALVGSLLALRYAKAERLHEKNTFG